MALHVWDKPPLSRKLHPAVFRYRFLDHPETAFRIDTTLCTCLRTCLYTCLPNRQQRVAAVCQIHAGGGIGISRSSIDPSSGSMWRAGRFSIDPSSGSMWRAGRPSRRSASRWCCQSRRSTSSSPYARTNTIIQDCSRHQHARTNSMPALIAYLHQQHARTNSMPAPTACPHQQHARTNIMPAPISCPHQK